MPSSGPNNQSSGAWHHAPPGRPRSFDDDAEERHAPAVLVVDDAPAVRLVLAAMVASHGYDPHPAGSGPEAVAVLRADRARIAAVVLDVQMPGMDGPATSMALREIRPDLPCVFVSGNTGAYSVRELFALGSVAVLGKPGLVEPLGHALAAALRTPPS